MIDWGVCCKFPSLHFAALIDSDEGSIFPGIHKVSRLRTEISGHSGLLLAQNFEVVLAVIVTFAILAICFARRCRNTVVSLVGGVTLCVLIPESMPAL